MTALDDLIWSELHPPAPRTYQPPAIAGPTSETLHRAAVALVAWHAEVLALSELNQKK